MQLSELKKYAEEMSAKYPHLDEEIRDFYFLAIDEVESGESESHECELAVNDIELLILEEKDNV